MCFNKYFLLVLFLFPIQAMSFPDEPIVKRIHAHMTIGDFQSACTEARGAIQEFPHSKPLWQAYIRALSKGSDEKTMMAQWRQFVAQFPEEIDNREILEYLAWSVIEKGASSSSPIIRVSSLLGAFFSQDAKGIAILQHGLRDENSFLRAAAIKLSSHLHDVSLQEELLRLFKEEPVWSVRLEAIEAVGKLNLVESRQALTEIIAQDNAHIEEKAAAIQSLILLSNNLDKEQLKKLVQSNKVGMRLLACELINYFDQKEDVDMLFPFFQDYHADVRAKLFYTLGCLRVDRIGGHSIVDLAAISISDPDPVVATTAAWVLMLNDQRKGANIFERLLKHKTRDIRYLAAAALAATGKYGLPLMKKVFKENDDPFIRMNLAIGLIGQRTDVDLACECLYDGLTQQKERWDWEHEGNFRILGPSKVKHDDALPNKPEAVNQLTRLEILEVLSIVQYPKAQQAIKLFLQESNWGISGLAAALLLTEGDDNAVDLVKALLQDSDSKVRTQAALILALWGKGEESVQVLQDAYFSADRELKGQILEGVGRVGSSTSLQFLAERLQEPYQTLRIIAAAALLECLYK